jgi:tape measure domain-containing protein
VPTVQRIGLVSIPAVGNEGIHNALTQMIQGLSARRLQGDELRATFEAIPMLRQLLVPIGPLFLVRTP